MARDKSTRQMRRDIGHASMELKKKDFVPTLGSMQFVKVHVDCAVCSSHILME